MSDAQHFCGESCKCSECGSLRFYHQNSNTHSCGVNHKEGRKACRGNRHVWYLPKTRDPLFGFIRCSGCGFLRTKLAQFHLGGKPGPFVLPPTIKVEDK